MSAKRTPTAITLALCLLLLGVAATQSASAESLPDGRVFEMVTPVNNDNADVHVPTALDGSNLGLEGTRTMLPFQAAADGSAITYPADATVGGLGQSEQGLGDQYLARRSATGNWNQVNIQPAGRRGTFYRGFSGNLSVGVLVSGEEATPRSPVLSPQAPGEGYAVLYACGLNAGTCSEGEAGSNPFVPLFTEPLNRSPDGFDAAEGGTPVSAALNELETVGAVFAGSASDGDLLFEVNDALLRGGGPLEEKLEQDVNDEIEAGEDNDYLYSWGGGQLSLVDILPNDEIARDATFGAPAFPNRPYENPPDFGDVISTGGNRVFWTDLTSGVVYVRVNGVETVQVSGGNNPARYWTASEDGQYAFYTEGATEGEKLYRFDATTRSREMLAGPDAGVLGVIGASGDGDEVYAVAEGKLTSSANREGATPVEGEPNLYLLRAGGPPVFVATLSREEDGTKAEPFVRAVSRRGIEYGDWVPGLGHRTAGVAAGGNAVFMSHERLKVVGYPNGYPNGGQAEVYMFDAAAERLFCVSCSSSGEPLPSSGGAAAYLPISWSNTYLPQWISDEGSRVFFDSSEPLVAQATDGRQNVYEWELEGTGGCAVGAGMNGGCIYLLSGGTSEADSWFIGASGSGDDAFIASRAQLTPEDHNETFNLFDAHACQPGEQCVLVTPPACTGSGCQGPPEPAPVFATPPSVTFDGVGNFPPPTELPAPAPKTKAKSLTNAQKLAKALRACRKQPRGRGRAGCEAAARKRYRPARANPSLKRKK
jgi:hypothetical protein